MSRGSRSSRGGGAPAIGLLAIAGVAQLAGPGPALIVGLGLFLLGLPHGAGDEDAEGLRPIASSHAFAYVACGLALAATFTIAPLSALTIFLALSAWHFARQTGVLTLSSLACSALLVGGSALWRPDATADVFAVLIDSPVPAFFMTALAILGLAGCLLAVAGAILGNEACARMACLVAAPAMFDPVLATGLVFFLGHALPEQMRQIEHYGVTAVWRAVRWPTFFAFAGALLTTWLVVAGFVPLTVAAALAIGLATPHMLTERLTKTAPRESLSA